MVGRGPAGAALPPQARRRVTARLRSLGEPGWTVAIASIVLYLFVVHSYRLPLGTTAIITGLIALALEGKRLTVPPFLLWFGAYLLWALAASPLGMDPGHSWERWQDFGKIWLIAFLIANAARSEQQWRIVLVGWLAMFALFPFRGTVMNYLSGITHAGRYAWNFAFENPNDLAAITLLILALCVSLVRAPRPHWVRWSARIGAATLPFLILLTGSRGAMLALVVFGAVLLAFSKRKLGTAVLVGVACVIALPFLPANLKERFGNMRFLTNTETLRQADGSAEQRYVILRVAATVARDHLLYGVGIGNYPYANKQYASQRAEWELADGFRDSHNTYLTIAAETGIPGLILMSGAAGSLLFGLLRARREGTRLAPHVSDPALAEALVNRPPALLAGTLAFMTAGIFGSLFYIIFPYLFAVSTYGITQVSLIRARRDLAFRDPSAGGAVAPPRHQSLRLGRRFAATRPRVA
mgnify:CR=1 FL=1